MWELTIDLNVSNLKFFSTIWLSFQFSLLYPVDIWKKVQFDHNLWRKRKENKSDTPQLKCFTYLGVRGINRPPWAMKSVDTQKIYLHRLTSSLRLPVLRRSATTGFKKLMNSHFKSTKSLYVLVSKCWYYSYKFH